MIALCTRSVAGRYVLKPLDPPNFPKNPHGGTIYWDGNSSAYRGNHLNYGGEAYGTFVDGTGTITTVYVWVRAQIPDPDHLGEMMDDPLDHPPEKVIAKEYCRAYAYPQDPLGGIRFASADNGLEFAPQEGEDPEMGSVWSESKGTRYKKLDGEPEITLTCTPGVTAFSDGLAHALVTYSSEIIEPPVKIVGATRFYAPHSLQFLTGQQITASIEQFPLNFPLEIAVHTWSVQLNQSSPAPLPATIFRNYVHSTALGKKHSHTQLDFQQPTFSFYTTKHESLFAQCNLVFKPAPAGSRYEGNLPNFTTKSWLMTSSRPVVTGLTGRVHDGLIQNYPQSNPYWHIFGPGPITSDGQVWSGVTFDPEEPFAHVGEVCFVQLCWLNRDLWRHAQQGYYFHFVYDCTKALDVNFPYPFGSGIWALPGSGVFLDSPRNWLDWQPGDGGGTDWYQSEIIDSFETWAMYRPPSVDGQPTTWIPMLRYKWGWSSVTEKLNGVWTPPSGSGGATAMPAEHFDHPEWNTSEPYPLTYTGVP